MATLNKMQERSNLKNQPNREQEYKKLNREIQKCCRKDKERYYEERCKELEDLDAKNFIKRLKKCNQKHLAQT